MSDIESVRFDLQDIHSRYPIRILGVADESPFDPMTWSGSSKYFFGTLNDLGVLETALSSKPSWLYNNLLRLLNFHCDISKWRHAYHMDFRLFKARTKKVLKKIEKERIDFDVFLQIGAWYDFTGLNKPLFSYHDGNMALRLKSPHPFPKVHKKIIKKALSYERDLYQRIDTLFSMSNWLKKSFVEDFGVNPKKIVTVYAGINMPDILNFPEKMYNQKNILFVGKDFIRKGGPDLLKAFAIVRRKIPDATLTIIGSKIRDLPKGVINPGFISKSSQDGLCKLKKYYEEGSVFVLPTIYEPFGIAFAEAMAHGLPCIGTNNCAVPEVVEHGKSGFLVDVKDYRTLADRIIKLLNSPDLCLNFGRNGFRRYRQDFNWSAVVKKMLSHIYPILSKSI